MSDTRLILHVKGTEAETTVLPKEAVRDAISQGKITHSQLIWIPSDSAWKPVRELPELLPDDRLILHVKGTESGTTQLPKKAVRAAISQGQITHSQLIWSSTENTWKQVRELPDLLPSQKLAPAPARAAVVPVPKRGVDAIIPESPTGPVARAVTASTRMPQVRVASAETPQVRVASAATPQVRVASAATPQVRVASAATPQVRVASAATPQVRVASAATPQVRVAPAEAPQVRVASAATPQVRVASAETPQIGVASVETPTVEEKAPQPPLPRSMVVKEDDTHNPFKWVCIGLGILIALVFGANYLLVDEPLVSNMGRTSYSNVPVAAHFGAFMQPTVIVIHIPASTKITPDNLIDFLVTLAHDTPQDPITGDLYQRVALTSGWTAQYSFSGSSWKELGDMKQESEAERKEFLTAQMDSADGESLMPESTLNETGKQADRERVWKTFVAHFAARQ